MRKKIVAGNWKMNQDLIAGKSLVTDILAGLPELNEHRQVIIAPPFTHLTQTVSQLSGRSNIFTAAQNCHHESSGAYTGEVSAAMLASAELKYVIVGHSERREYFGETDGMLAQKTNAALAAGMNVIFCCGEPLSVRDTETQNAYVEAQIRAGLFHLDAAAIQHVVLAYEPIWAIGTGRTASAQQAQDMHEHIRMVIMNQYGQEVAANMTILYGGSCKPSNAAELFACPDVDGGLIGGASLKAEEFLGIIQAMMQS